MKPTALLKWIKWEGDINSFIMWVQGPAGAGKSTIAQTIAEMCEEEMVFLARFFFSRNDPSRILTAVEHDPLIFFKSLAVQLKYLIVEPLQ
jgi:replication-associated recombination protein RarA